MSGSIIVRSKQKALWLWRRARTKHPQLETLRHGAKSVTVRSTQRLATRQAGSEPSVNPANITWIFCVGRSGSTWLSDMMGELSGHKIWMEPRIGELFGEFYANTPKWKRDSANFIMGAPTRKAWISSIRNFVLVGAQYAFPLLRPEHHLIIKDVNGGVGAPLLMEALPESRMILLVRDPRDIAASVARRRERGGLEEERTEEQRAKSPGNPAHVRKLARKYLNNLQMAKQALRRSPGAQNAGALRGPEGRHSRSHETLVLGSCDGGGRHPARASRGEVCLGEHTRGHEGRRQIFRKASPGGWSEDLTPEQAEMVERITAPVLAEFYA